MKNQKRCIYFNTAILLIASIICFVFTNILISAPSLYSTVFSHICDDNIPSEEKEWSWKDDECVKYYSLDSDIIEISKDNAITIYSTVGCSFLIASFVYFNHNRSALKK